MYEKIKIYTTKRVSDILTKDAENFGFFKKDGITPNKNAMLSTLLVNYFETYTQKRLEKNTKIENLIKNSTNMPSKQAAELSNTILNQLNEDDFEEKSEKYNQLVSIKPTIETNPIIEYIENYLLQYDSLSKYLRNMFTSYAALPQDRRETIIFKPLYNTLTEAIKKQKKVFIITKRGQQHIEITPYAIALTKEEMHLYLLYTINRSCRTIKLSSIESARVVDKPALFNAEERAILGKMQAKNPQFVYLPNSEPIVVKFTPKGINLFQKIYLHRPTPTNIEGDTYTFDCSYMQALFYFVRFGDEIEVISPQYVRTGVRNFHKNAAKIYEG